jgi:hypothetical protein
VSTLRDWWPRFHDTAYAPPLREQVAIHWHANLLMLRSPRAVVLFFLWSGWPIVALLGLWWIAGFLDPEDPLLLRGPLWLATAAGSFLVFLLVQHVAFVAAMDRTYGPFVREVLVLRGVPICRSCGHLLGADQRACGECGEQREAPPRPVP